MVEFLSLLFFFCHYSIDYQEYFSPPQYKHIEVFNLLLQPKLGIKKHPIFICFIVQCMSLNVSMDKVVVFAVQCFLFVFLKH